MAFPPNVPNPMFMTKVKVASGEPLSSSTQKLNHVIGLSIRAHLLLMQVYCVAPLLAVITVVMLIYIHDQQKAHDQNLLAIAQLLAASVEQKIEVAHAALEVLATAQSVREHNYEELYRRSGDVGALHNGRIILQDREQALFNTREPFGSKLFAPREWRNRVIDTGDWEVSDLYVSRSTGLPVFGVAVPVLEDGRPIAALAMSQDPSTLIDMLAGRNFPEGWRAAIVDRNGVVMARNVTNASYVGAKTSADFQERTQGGRDGVFTTTALDGLPVRTAFTRVFGGWVVAVGAEQRLLDAPLMASLMRIGLGGSVVLFLACSFAYWRGEQLSVATKLLRSAAQALGRGTPPPPIERFAFREAAEVYRAQADAGRLLDSRLSERDLAIAELRLLAASQEGVIQERMRELNAALWASENANRAKSEFLASMSHELRTPLNAILGFAQMLEIRIGSPRDKEYASYIVMAGEHLHKLINDLLDLARIESGHLTVSQDSVSLSETIARTISTLDPLAKANDVDLAPHRTAEERFVLGDAARVLQIFLNFGANGIKYNKPGGSLRVEVSRSEPGWVRTSFIDTGTGIPLDRQKHVFESFNRLGVNQAKIEGTGIGLAISRKLALLMGGRVGFVSKPGEGSVFWLELQEAAEGSNGRLSKA